MGFLDSIKNSSFVKWVVNLLQSIKLPGMNGISLYELIRVYINGIAQLELGNRVSAISWRLFLGLFPFILFFLLFVQILPGYEVIENYFYTEILAKILPKSAIDSAADFLNSRQETLNNRYQNSSFFTILFGIIIYLFSSTMGINSLIKGLNFSNDDENYERTRSGLKQFSTALYLNLLLTTFLILTLLIYYYVDVVGSVLEKQGEILNSLKDTFDYIKYFLFALFYFTAICAIYYIGPTKKLSLKQIFPGAIMTTLLYLLNISIFGYYISNVANLNLLYGSFATILIIMISLYINVMLIIIGYQLNISIIESKTLSKNEPDSVSN